MSEKADPLDLDSVWGDDVSPEEKEIRLNLQAICDADPRKLHDEEGNVLPISEWPDTEASALERHTYNPKTGLWTFKFFDKIKAADALSRLDGLYKQDKLNDNPLVILFDRLPREQLKLIGEQLAYMREYQPSLEQFEVAEDE